MLTLGQLLILVFPNTRGFGNRPEKASMKNRLEKNSIGKNSVL